MISLLKVAVFHFSDIWLSIYSFLHLE